VLARFQVAGLDAPSEVLLLVGRQERDLVDFDQVGLKAAFGRNGSGS